jgi:LysR family transcriptional regulator, glycine cleavage system transcriptional activator
LDWFNAAGFGEADVSRGPVMNRAAMLIDAAVNAQGVALARTTLAAAGLLSGRLIRAAEFAMALSESYWIVCLKSASAQPKIRIFREWLIGEAQDDLRQLADAG